ncbi:unnamed protein product [Didymodactylos carnosus]|uniref:K Homology domain-containing protein n=1 Tax=Didymodactylos carnosus TaxID=1234261 RepID=A0A8S2NII4_9BILA|nr:unnamed protein product [Didymodactylos carnosus]CAF4003285.1 unnamed protein product [Didymodactylos carnosus]
MSFEKKKFLPKVRDFKIWPDKDMTDVQQLPSLSSATASGISLQQYSTITTSDRATLKIEIPFTDHAHCIGRQGNQIQTIMSSTDTHIHFPDGNRDPNGIKSNQVSISGSITAIEQARQRIREILPMSLKFLIPPSQLLNIVNDEYPLFKNVRTRFNVVVMPRPYAKTGEVYCIVRGMINQPGLAEGAEYLIQSFYGCEAPLVTVTCQTEISEQYHVYLQTRQQPKDLCISSIELYTRTQIQFPLCASQQQDMSNSSSYARRTSVIIVGSPANVCLARQLLDFCLPIILTFEILPDKEPSRFLTAQLKDKLNVTTTLRTRKDKIGKLVTVQSQEWNVDNLYRARSSMLGFLQDELLLKTSVTNNDIQPPLSNVDLFDLRLKLNDGTAFGHDLTTQTTVLLTPSNFPDIYIPLETGSASCYISDHDSKSINNSSIIAALPPPPPPPPLLPPPPQLYVTMNFLINQFSCSVCILRVEYMKKPIGHERLTSKNLETSDNDIIIWPDHSLPSVR